MNKIILVGNITQDPEVRYTTSADPTMYALFGIAVKRPYSRQGEPDTDFFNLIAWGPKAEFAEKYVRKGAKFAIVGRVKIDKKEDGQGHKQTYVSVVVEEFEFGESKSSAESRGVSTGGASTQGWIPQPTMEEDDDLPF